MLLIENFEFKSIWLSTGSEDLTTALDFVDYHIHLNSEFSINNMNFWKQKIIWKFVYILIVYEKGFGT